jgi:predicted membrane-bound spermidine synthase
MSTPPSLTPSDRGRFLTFALLFILSGMSGLMYQVVWARKLQLTFGVSIFAIASVLAAYFLGMALGAWLAGRASGSIKRPLLVYGLAEIGIGLSALWVTPYVERLDEALSVLGTLADDQFWLMQGARFLLTLGLLIVPTTLLGATVPLMNHGLIRHARHLGGRVATLYATNTFGAVLGVLLSGFFLIENIGLNHTLQLAAALSIGVGLMALYLGRSDAEQPTVAVIQASAATSAQTRELLLVMGVSGALGLSLEVLWTRILIQGISSTAYVFAVVLALFLIGITLGSALVRFYSHRIHNVRFALAWSQALAAILTLASVPMLVWIMPRVLNQLFALAGSDPGEHYFIVWSLWSSSALLPPTIALGASFPLAARLIAQETGTVGKGIGQMYAVNTYGGVLGSLLTGFLLLPFLGIYWTLTLLAVLYAALALLLVRREKREVVLRYTLAPLMAAFIVWAALPKDLIYNRMNANVQGRILSQFEDYYGSVVLNEEVGETRYKRLSVNGVSYSGTAPSAMHYMRLQGHLPVLLTPAEHRKALVICLGVGLTAGAVSTHPNTDLTVVELSRGIVGLSPFFSDVNEGVYLRPDVRLVNDDGRNYLLRHPEIRYDIVTLEPPPPQHAGMAHLYSADFYRLVKSRLSSDGVAVQWIPLHTQSNESSRMLMASFVAVFPNSSLWWTEAGETLLLGYASPTAKVKLGQLGMRMAVHNVARSLGEIGIHSPVQIASHFLLDGEGLKRYVAGVSPMTDDLPRIEYQTPDINATNYKVLLQEVIALRPSPQSIVTHLGLDVDELPALKQAQSELQFRWMTQQLF